MSVLKHVMLVLIRVDNSGQVLVLVSEWPVAAELLLLFCYLVVVENNNGGGNGKTSAAVSLSSFSHLRSPTPRLLPEPVPADVRVKRQASVTQHHQRCRYCK
jgi:hypothetical protein